MRILAWHVHGGWMDAFVRGDHDYLLPTTPARDSWGLGRGGRDWPSRAVEIAPNRLRDADVDVVVLQRPQEVERAQHLLGRRLGRDIPALYVEHNTPRGDAPATRHPLAERRDIPVVHVTHFNRLMWDCGDAPTLVIPHGIPDPGARYTGELGRAAVVVNEPVRRWRVAGTDLLTRFLDAAGLDVFGMGADDLPPAVGRPSGLRALGDVPPPTLHAELGRRRVYVHPMRWTSLGLSLLEAMHVGMPVVALDTTEASRAVPPEAGLVSADVDELVDHVRELVHDPELAARRGAAARDHALEHFGLPAFLDRWDDALHAAVEDRIRRRGASVAAQERSTA